MSWTISIHLPPSKEITALRAALKAASDDDILMFASASDQGEHNDELLFPGRSERADCVRVGAASNEGDMLPWVNPAWSEFSIPGKEISFRDHETNLYFTETGSSLANACAAGLAGALLYCDRLLAVPSEKRDLRSSVQMKRMFRGLSRNPNGKFVDVVTFLEKPLKGMLEEKGLKQKGVPLQIDQINWGTESKDALTEVLERSWVRNP
jgi:hypothetical protein